MSGAPQATSLDWDSFEPVDEATWRARVEADLRGRGPDQLARTLAEGVAARVFYAAGAGSAPAVDPWPGQGLWTRGVAAGPAPWVIACSYTPGPSGTPDPSGELVSRIAEDAALGAGAAWVRAATAGVAPSPEVAQGWAEAAQSGRATSGEVYLELGAQLDAAQSLAAIEGVQPVLDPVADLARGLSASTEGTDPGDALGRLAEHPQVWLGIDTAPYQEAGADAPTQLAAMLSKGAWLLRRGVPAPAVLATLAVGRDIFAEIAKLRAARRLWARLAEAFGVAPQARGLRLRAVGSRRDRSARDPWVNLLRATTETFAAAVGGAELVDIPPLDAVDGPDAGAFGRRLAINTQLVLREESQLWRVLDPAGGSHYVEALTDTLARASWAAFQSLEAEGGLLASLRSGALATRVAEQHAREARDVATRRAAIVGVSMYTQLEDRPVPGAPPGRPPPASAAGRPHEAAEGSTRPAGFPLRRRARPYEALRDRADAATEASGHRPSALLVGLGPVAEHKARADFARDLLTAGGFDVPPVAAVADAVGALAAARGPAPGQAPAVVVLCGADTRYAEQVPTCAAALAELRPRPQVVLAGRGGEAESAWRSAGVDRFIYLGCDALAELEALLDAATGASR